MSRKRQTQGGSHEPGSARGKNHKKAKTTNHQHKTSVKERPSQLDKPLRGSTLQDALLFEIKALGGDEHDLALIEAIDSDDEMEAKTGSHSLDKGLAEDLAHLANDLGLGRQEGRTLASEEPSEDETNESPAPRVEADAALLGMAFTPRPDWHAVTLEPRQDNSSSENTTSPKTVNDLRSHARALLEADASLYASRASNSSARQFLSTIMSSGTTSDKVSALTLAIQDSPVHNVNAFESLLGLAGARNRDQAIGALGALVDLLGPGLLLPSDRRLRRFVDQPGLRGIFHHLARSRWAPGMELPVGLTKAHLISWIFEDWLKDSYFKVIQIIEAWSRDEIPYSRSRAIDFIFGLLRDKPEQEANLLRLLVNKLGDRDRKVASRTSHLLLQLLNRHPRMKPIVIGTVEEELLRPGQTLRAKYYAMNTLNQIILSSQEADVANNLTRIYFDLFMVLLKSGSLENAEDMPGPPSGTTLTAVSHNPRGTRKIQNRELNRGTESDVTEKLVSAVLTGINRAIPFVSADESTLLSNMDTLFRVTHSSNFNTSIQALSLAQRFASLRQIAGDRFYRALYESLLDPRLVSSSKQSLYLNVLYRALTSDFDLRRVKAFVKRMLQTLHMHQPPFVCAILYLTAVLVDKFPDIKTLLDQPEERGSDGDVLANAGVFDDASRSGHYDGRKRQPEYSNAHTTCLWELSPLLSHFHPAVSLYATNLLSRSETVKKPELASHTLIHFLDKFVYRQPKVAERPRGESIMQPAAVAAESSLIWSQKGGARRTGVMNSPRFWSTRLSDVAVDDIFFHRYFSRSSKGSSFAMERRGDEEGSSLGNAEDEEDDIWKAMVESADVGDDGSDGDGFDAGDIHDDTGEDSQDESQDSDTSAGDEGRDDNIADDFDGLISSSDMEPQAKESIPNDRDKKMRRDKLKNAPVFAWAEEFEKIL